MNDTFVVCLGYSHTRFNDWHLHVAALHQDPEAHVLMLRDATLSFCSPVNNNMQVGRFESSGDWKEHVFWNGL